MPSGITSEIYDGKDVSIADFAARVGRQMGYFMHMRDEPNDAPLTYPNDLWTNKDSFYVKALRDIKQEKALWLAMTEEQRYAKWSDYYREGKVKVAEQIARDAELRFRYTRMLAKIEAVDVSNEQLMESTKENMIRYINESIEFDCSDDPGKYYEPAEYIAWCKDTEAYFARNIPRYESSIAEEQTRDDDRAAYIEAFSRVFGVKVLPHEES